MELAYNRKIVNFNIHIWKGRYKYLATTDNVKEKPIPLPFMYVIGERKPLALNLDILSFCGSGEGLKNLSQFFFWFLEGHLRLMVLCTLQLMLAFQSFRERYLILPMCV